MSLREKFTSYLQKHQLWAPTDKWLLAVSGGVDSMVLSHLCYELHIPFAMAYCHFGLRPRAADKEAAFVKYTAEQYNVVYHTQKFDTTGFAKAQKLSIQMAARVLRYNWFKKLLKRSLYTKIATAHHHNDQMETCLHNFIKGTNLCGLQGMLPKHHDVIRPLLFAMKRELYSYARSQGLSWHEDESNQSLYYRRNWIRHKIMPLFNYVNPNSERTFFTTLNKLQQIQAFFSAYAQKCKEGWWRYEPPYYYIDYRSFMDKPWVAMLMTHWLEPFGFTFRRLRGWCARCHEAGKKIFSPTHWLLQDRDVWVLGARVATNCLSVSIAASQTSVTVETLYKLSLCYTTQQPSTMEGDDDVWLDCDKLSFPLRVRVWQAGDIFCPLGMRGKHKKVSDLLIDRKIPLYKKRQTYVLCSGENIVWVMGECMDDRYKITPSTKRFLHIQRVCFTQGSFERPNI